MQVEIKVPALPESVAEGTLGDWHKQVGDSVAAEENIVDLETDKVVLEIVASKAGVIGFTKSLAKETADHDIAINCITPAAAKTRIFDQITQQHIRARRCVRPSRVGRGSRAARPAA